jgi:hypothetical protein
MAPPTGNTLRRHLNEQGRDSAKKLRTIVRFEPDVPDPPPLTGPQADDLASIFDNNEARQASLQQVQSEGEQLQ